jgi:hypothetical protein
LVLPSVLHYESAPGIHRVGERFTVGSWTYIVNSVGVRDYLYELGQRQVPNSASWTVVDLIVTNDDRTSGTRPPIVLVDAAGREFTETPLFGAEFLSQMEPLNPGVGKRGLILFDVPKGKYQLKVSGGHESGEHALVDLP